MRRDGSREPRPPYIGADWSKHTNGFSFAAAAPHDLASDRYLASPHPWERLACLFSQARAGDFRNVASAIDIAASTTDIHLGTSALKLFVHAAPSRALGRIAEVFDHPDWDIRTESYVSCPLSCDLAVAEPLIALLPRRSGEEREYVAGALWDLLDPERGDGSRLIELNHDPVAQASVARQLVRRFVSDNGPETAVYRGAPLSLRTIAATIRELVADEEYQDFGGDVDDLLAIVEAMTGIPRVGCVSDDVLPVFLEVALLLDRFEQSARYDELETGRRYFFGHLVPR